MYDLPRFGNPSVYTIGKLEVQGVGKSLYFLISQKQHRPRLDQTSPPVVVI
jgi:hypothetical protein